MATDDQQRGDDIRNADDTDHIDDADRTDDSESTETETERRARLDPTQLAEDAGELIGAGSDDERQVAEPIDDEPGPIPNA